MFELRLVHIQPSYHLDTRQSPTRSRHGSCTIPPAPLTALSPIRTIFSDSHPPRLVTDPPPGLGIEGLLSGSEERASSQVQQTGPPLMLSCSAKRAFSRARHRGPLPSVKTRLDTEGLLSGSAERVSCRARKRGSPPRYDTEPPLKINTGGLLSSSKQRASSRARHRGPPPNLSREGLVSCSRRGPPLGLGEEGFLSGSSQTASYQGLSTGASSRAQQRASSQTRNRGPPLMLDTEHLTVRRKVMKCSKETTNTIR